MTQGMDVSEQDMDVWHGAQKKEVIEHFARREFFHAALVDDQPLQGPEQSRLDEILATVEAAFVEELAKYYFSDASPIKLIDPRLPEYLDGLRSKGVKVALNTGYPRKLQQGLIDSLHMRDFIDHFVSAQDVACGRPSPFMVHRLMEALNVHDVLTVAKVGDTVRDIEEGKNAGCALNIGVLSGADNADSLSRAGADMIVANIVSIPHDVFLRPEL